MSSSMTSLQSSSASTMMWWPELVPHSVGEAGPSELTLNWDFWHWVLPLAAVSPGYNTLDNHDHDDTLEHKDDDKCTECSKNKYDEKYIQRHKLRDVKCVFLDCWWLRSNECIKVKSQLTNIWTSFTNFECAGGGIWSRTLEWEFSENHLRQWWILWSKCCWWR